MYVSLIILCWCSSLGKPRRFSQQFLKEEKEKLYLYRDSVRKHYDELNTGMREGLPMDLARPLNVSQRVICLHPKSREIHDGSVLTVDHCRYRIQFDNPELGVEFVKVLFLQLQIFSGISRIRIFDLKNQREYGIILKLKKREE